MTINAFHRKFADPQFKADVRQVFDDIIAKGSFDVSRKQTTLLFDSWYSSMSRYCIGMSVDVGWYGLIRYEMTNLGADPSLASILGFAHQDPRIEPHWAHLGRRTPQNDVI